jgi:putative ABC transport system permease protein
MYLPHAQFVRMKAGGAPRFGMTLVARTEGDPLALAPAVRGLVRRLDPRLPVSDVRTLETVAAGALAEPRFTAAVMTGFAALALALAGTGLYGVLAYVTARRTREIGVRMALGAAPSSVARLVARDGVAPAVAGIAVGLAAAVAVARMLAGQTHGIAPLDPVAFAATPAVLLAVATLAAAVPAWRAARGSAVAALREG